MKNRWSEEEADAFVARYGEQWGETLARRTYVTRLIGSERGLVLHGGGNSSVKTIRTDILGERVSAIFVKASGYDMATIEPDGHTGLYLEYLRRMRRLEDLSDEQMVNEFRTHLFDFRAATPSMETLVHAFLPAKFVDHSHADAVLALTNQPDGKRIVQEALGEDIAVVNYVKPGFQLAKACAAAYEAKPDARAMVLMQHGLITWGDMARESYDTTIALVCQAEDYLKQAATRPLQVAVPVPTPLPEAEGRLTRIAAVCRGLLAQPVDNADQPYRRVVLQPLITREVLDFLESDQGRTLALSPPLTSDHIIRTKSLPLWVDDPCFDDPERLRKQLTGALAGYAGAYEAYFQKHRHLMTSDMPMFDALPRVILLPGIGALCAGRDIHEATVVMDITEQTLAVKAQIAAMGADYLGMAEADLFGMEYRPLQQDKISRTAPFPLRGHTALVTGSAGAIGSGIAQELLENGCHVALTDLPGEHLNRLLKELHALYGPRVMAVPMDVTDPNSVSQGFDSVTGTWGGVDLVVVNAGVAMVSSLSQMSLGAFRKVEQVNVEGSLLVMSEALRHFQLQGTGGDIVMISSKNVFSPGAQFGAYSATKAASHQLARIASLEGAPMGVRVNMVSPDAVFGGGARKSGLWAEIGPDRMRARGLTEEGLEEYYKERNLLKAKITPLHVARAVLFLATRQTPSTGITIPVDGGLPDATPR